MCFKRQNHFNLFWLGFLYIKMLPLCHIQISPNNKSIHITRTRVYAQRGPNRIGNTNSREEKKRTTHTNNYKTNAKQKGLKIFFWGYVYALQQIKYIGFSYAPPSLVKTLLTAQISTMLVLVGCSDVWFILHLFSANVWLHSKNANKSFILRKFLCTNYY